MTIRRHGSITVYNSEGISVCPDLTFEDTFAISYRAFVEPADVLGPSSLAVAIRVGNPYRLRYHDHAAGSFDVSGNPCDEAVEISDSGLVGLRMFGHDRLTFFGMTIRNSVETFEIFPASADYVPCLVDSRFPDAPIWITSGISEIENKEQIKFMSKTNKVSSAEYDFSLVYYSPLYNPNSGIPTVSVENKSNNALDARLDKVEALLGLVGSGSGSGTGSGSGSSSAIIAIDIEDLKKRVLTLEGQASENLEVDAKQEADIKTNTKAIGNIDVVLDEIIG